MTETAAKTKKKSQGLGETIRTVVYAVLIALVVRAFAYEPFNIPSGSMIPTLLVGDYLFVSKFSYGYSRFSLPFSPRLFEGRVLASEPERGDVAVFKLPRDESTDYIKRIVGMPGDSIYLRGGVLYINDVEVKRRRIEDFVDTDSFGNSRRVRQYVETLPNGVSYRVLDELDTGPLDNTLVYRVPPDHYFMMGDNRDNSQDSRVGRARGGVGFVPFVNLVGRADFLFFSTDQSAAWWEVWRWPGAIRFGRILDPVS